MAESSFVNEQNGEQFTLPEYMDRLRGLERTIGRYDTVIANLKGDLSTAKKARDKTGAELRDLIREIKMLTGTAPKPRRRVAQASS